MSIKVKLLRLDEVPEPGGVLAASEMEKYSGFKVQKRRRDWLGGRYAAKTLVKTAFGLKVPLTDILISYDAYGRPVAGKYLVSITHSGPYCAAACGSGFIGIDLEKAEPRAPAWYKDYFSKAELPEPGQSAATRLWTIKEALLKALGLGLKADPLDIEVVGEVVKLNRAALERYKELGSPEYHIQCSEPAAGYNLAAVFRKTSPSKLAKIK